jgi:hypothetical protein
MTGRARSLDTVGRKVLSRKLRIGDITVRTENFVGISGDRLTAIIDIFTKFHACSVIDVRSLQCLIDTKLGSFIEELDDVFTHTIMIFITDSDTIEDSIDLDREELVRDCRTFEVEILHNRLIFEECQVSGVSFTAIHTSTVTLDEFLELFEAIIITNLL